MFVRTQYKPNQYWDNRYPHKVVYVSAYPTNDGSGERVEIHTDISTFLRSKKLPKLTTREQLKSLGKKATETAHLKGWRSLKLAIVGWTVTKPIKQKKKK